MTTTKAREIAGSFINGNISRVKECTKTKKSFLKVLAALEDMELWDSVASFKRICG